MSLLCPSNGGRGCRQRERIAGRAAAGGAWRTLAATDHRRPAKFIAHEFEMDAAAASQGARTTTGRGAPVSMPR
jgi:hypothetical protein